MNKEDISTLKSFRGNLEYADRYMREEMSERVIFDGDKPDRLILDNILGHISG